jgi:hypothetical protein
MAPAGSRKQARCAPIVRAAAVGARDDATLFVAIEVCSALFAAALLQAEFDGDAQVVRMPANPFGGRLRRTMQV